MTPSASEAGFNRFQSLCLWYECMNKHTRPSLIKTEMIDVILVTVYQHIIFAFVDLASVLEYLSTLAPVHICS